MRIGGGIKNMHDDDKEEIKTIAREQKKLLKKVSKIFSYNIFCDLDFATVMNVIDILKMKNMHNSMPIFNYLVILDDVISNKSSQDDQFLKLFASSRHSHFSMIYLIQFTTADYANNSIKNNCTHLIFTKPNSADSRKMIMRNYLDTFVDNITGMDDDPIKIKEIKKQVILKLWGPDAKPYIKLVYNCNDGSINWVL